MEDAISVAVVVEEDASAEDGWRRRQAMVAMAAVVVMRIVDVSVLFSLSLAFVCSFALRCCWIVFALTLLASSFGSS